MRSKLRNWLLKILGVDHRLADGKRLYTTVTIEFPLDRRKALMYVYSKCERYLVHSQVVFRDDEYGVLGKGARDTHELTMVLLEEDYPKIMEYVGGIYYFNPKITHKLEWSNEY